MTMPKPVLSPLLLALLCSTVHGLVLSGIKSTGMRISSVSSLSCGIHRGTFPTIHGASKGRSIVMMGSAGDSLSTRTNIANKLRTSSWFAWWSQTILSVVSTVTLIFANAVKGSSTSSIISNGFLLAAIGLSLCYINIIWTWTYGTLANSLPDKAEKAVRNLQRTVKVGIVIALVGMLVTLIGAEQIVGTLVAKTISVVLVSPQAGSMAAAGGSMALQPLDIFVVQANTNTLLSHLASLINSLYISNLLSAQSPATSAA